MTTEEKTKPITDLFEQALKNYEQAMKSGMKFQEENARVWTALANPATAPQEWQKRVKALAEEVIPQSQKGIEESLKLMEHNSRVSLDLLKKAAAAAQAGSPQDAQAKLLVLWESSVNAVRDSVIAATQTNQKAVEHWMSLARKTAETPAAGAKN